jgi:hypothetical protein
MVTPQMMSLVWALVNPPLQQGVPECSMPAALPLPLNTGSGIDIWHVQGRLLTSASGPDRFI